MSTTEDAIQEIRGDVYGKLFHEESELNEGQKKRGLGQDRAMWGFHPIL